MTTSRRLLPLEGGHNFRDLGGYATEDGRTVKWERLFRSGVMAHLTDADYAYLRDKGIRVICDFRSIGERKREPTVWRAAAADAVTYLAWDYQHSSGVLQEVVNSLMTADRVKAVMKELYEQLAYDHADKYRVLFERLAEGDVPLVFNCSAGKDRTGIAAALVLTALGVSRDAIIEDYNLTETVVDYSKFRKRIQALARDRESHWAFLSEVPADVLKPLLRSDPDYIQSFFESMETRHGSVEGFITDELGVSGAQIDRIRDHLLE